jgi:hypothetical protein
VSRTRVLCGAIAAAILALAVALAPGDARERRGPIARLAGPFGPLLASAQWVRVQAAVSSGRDGLAFARAETALALDPASTAGWEIVAAHQGLYLAAPEREPDVARRAAWLTAALATCRRGEERARDPGALAWYRGLLWRTRAFDEVPIRPREEMLLEAARAFDEAAVLGYPGASESAAWARRHAVEAD